MKNFIISEYGCIYHQKPNNLNDKFKHKEVTEEQFKELEEYRNQNEKTESIFTRVTAKCIRATSYVGIIQTKNLSIEILPKIYKKDEELITRNIFIQMLKPLLDINEVQINKADLSTTKNKNIYEMFISMFVEYLDELIHKGLKSSYIPKEDNQYFLKGKLKFNQHIKQNYIRKERFYVEFDEYRIDRVENRLLKSTIELLLKKTNDYDNKRALRQQLLIFNEVQLSSNYDIEISKINIHRGMEYYEMPLRFAKVFLKHESFSSLRGKDNVFALLFPMETVFEKYMEFVLNNSKDKLGIKNIFVNGRSDEYLLSDGSCKMARLEPDYLLEMKNGKNIVTDAKWKLLIPKENETKGCDTINISSGDVYQIFSYLHFYDCQNTAYLFVPQTSSFTEPKELTYHTVMKTEDKKIKIIPINLKSLVKSHKFELQKDIINEFK